MRSMCDAEVPTERVDRGERYIERGRGREGERKEEVGTQLGARG